MYDIHIAQEPSSLSRGCAVMSS